MTYYFSWWLSVKNFYQMVVRMVLSMNLSEPSSPLILISLLLLSSWITCRRSLSSSFLISSWILSMTIGKNWKELMATFSITPMELEMKQAEYLVRMNTRLPKELARLRKAQILHRQIRDSWGGRWTRQNCRWDYSLSLLSKTSWTSLSKEIIPWSAMIQLLRMSYRTRK